MNNDRAFAIFSVILVGAVLSVLTASVSAGLATMPTAFTLVEHIALSLTFRAAYHSFDMRPLWPFGSVETERMVEATQSVVSPGGPEGALG